MGQYEKEYLIRLVMFAGLLVAMMILGMVRAV
jgi:hypothetical protein